MCIKNFLVRNTVLYCTKHIIYFLFIFFYRGTLDSFGWWRPFAGVPGGVLCSPALQALSEERPCKIWHQRWQRSSTSQRSEWSCFSSFLLHGWGGSKNKWNVLLLLLLLLLFILFYLLIFFAQHNFFKKRLIY